MATERTYAGRSAQERRDARRRALLDAGLELIPVLNKVDLPGADPDGVAAQVADLLGGDPGEALRISAKTGEGVTDVLESIVQRIPPPEGQSEAPPRALIFDSEFDQYRGVVAFVRMVDGRFTKDEQITALLSKQYGVPAISLAQFKIDPTIVKLVPTETARKYQMIPLSRSGSTLTIAMTDPTNVFAMDDIKFMTGYTVEPVVTSEVAITDAIEAHSTPSTPPSAHDGTRPGGGASGYRSR